MPYVLQVSTLSMRKAGYVAGLYLRRGKAWQGLGSKLC